MKTNEGLGVKPLKAKTRAYYAPVHTVDPWLGLIFSSNVELLERKPQPCMRCREVLTWFVWTWSACACYPKNEKDGQCWEAWSDETYNLHHFLLNWWSLGGLNTSRVCFVQVVLGSNRASSMAHNSCETFSFRFVWRGRSREFRLWPISHPMHGFAQLPL